MDKTTRQHEEQQIIRRILDGRTECFAEIVGRYQRPIYALVSRITGDDAEAEELTQDVFMKAYKALGSFRGTCAFSTWLFRIAYNTAISGTRRPKRELRGVDEQRLSAVADHEADALFASEDQQRLEALTLAISKLTHDERALLHLYYYDSQSINACAEILGLSEANIKVRLHRIRKNYTF